MVVGEKRELDDALKPEHRPMLAKTKAWWAAGYAWGCRSAPAPGVEASAVNRRISVGRSTEGGAREAVSCQEFTHEPFFLIFSDPGFQGRGVESSHLTPAMGAAFIAEMRARVR